MKLVQLALKYWYIIVIVLLLSTLGIMRTVNKNLRTDNKRQTENFRNLSNEKDQQLNLKEAEWIVWDSKTKDKIDSLEKANDILHKRVRSAQIINTSFKDTSHTDVTHGLPVIETPSDTIKPPILPIFDITVSKEEYCWGMKGVIKTTDPKARLTITERTANNSVQRIEVSNRFLGFLWMTKKSKFRVYTDCGDSEVKNINFIK